MRVNVNTRSKKTVVSRPLNNTTGNTEDNFATPNSIYKMATCVLVLL